VRARYCFNPQSHISISNASKFDGVRAQREGDDEFFSFVARNRTAPKLKHWKSPQSISSTEKVVLTLMGVHCKCTMHYTHDTQIPIPNCTKYAGSFYNVARLAWSLLCSFDCCLLALLRVQLQLATGSLPNTITQQHKQNTSQASNRRPPRVPLDVRVQ
jgi:hypothetical protein